MRDTTGTVCSPPERLKINIAAYGGVAGVLVALWLLQPKVHISYILKSYI